jgi:ubiquinone/menaquinone biosynthesis C-methylase UbiE
MLTYSDKITAGNIQSMDFSDNTFDVVVCGWVLYYSSTIKKALNEMRRVMKDGAKLVIGFSITDNYQLNFFQFGDIPITSSMNSDTTGNIVEKLSIKDLISDFKIESLSIGKFT